MSCKRSKSCFREIPFCLQNSLQVTLAKQAGKLMTALKKTGGTYIITGNEQS